MVARPHIARHVVLYYVDVMLSAICTRDYTFCIAQCFFACEVNKHNIVEVYYKSKDYTNDPQHSAKASTYVRTLH